MIIISRGKLDILGIMKTNAIIYPLQKKPRVPPPHNNRKKAKIPVQCQIYQNTTQQGLIYKIAIEKIIQSSGNSSIAPASPPPALLLKLLIGQTPWLLLALIIQLLYLMKNELHVLHALFQISDSR